MQPIWAENLSSRFAAVDIIVQQQPITDIRQTPTEQMLVDAALVAATQLGYGVRVWRDAGGFHAHPAREITVGFVHDTSAIVRTT